MKFGKRTQLWVGVMVVVLFVLVGIGDQAMASGGTTGKACPSMTKSGCAASKMGMCGGAAKSGCCAAKGASAGVSGPMKASAAFPAGTMVTPVEVPGGMDLLFVGKDLAAIETTLKTHITKCTTDKGCAGNTCNVTSSPQGVTLAIRGENPHPCCMGLMDPEACGAGAGMGTMKNCPGMKAKAATDTKANPTTNVVKKG